MGKKKHKKPVPDAEEVDWEWVGTPIPLNEVQRLWPHRKCCFGPAAAEMPHDYLSAEHASANEVRSWRHFSKWSTKIMH